MKVFKITYLMESYIICYIFMLYPQPERVLFSSYLFHMVYCVRNLLGSARVWGVCTCIGSHRYAIIFIKSTIPYYIGNRVNEITYERHVHVCIRYFIII